MTTPDPNVPLSSSPEHLSPKPYLALEIILRNTHACLVEANSTQMLFPELLLPGLKTQVAAGIAYCNLTPAQAALVRAILAALGQE